MGDPRLAEMDERLVKLDERIDRLRAAILTVAGSLPFPFRDAVMSLLGAALPLAAVQRIQAATAPPTPWTFHGPNGRGGLGVVWAVREEDARHLALKTLGPLDPSLNPLDVVVAPLEVVPGKVLFLEPSYLDDPTQAPEYLCTGE